jgi:hypothetical protein
MKAKRRQLTAAQKQAAIERRMQFRKLAKLVSQMSLDERMTLCERFGIVTVEGRQLSPFNAVLCPMQRPDVSLVGGLQQWRRTGRMVRRGEHGMMIWIPRKGKKSDESRAGEPEGDVFSLVDAAEGTEVSTNKFFIGTVFDIAQTEPIINGVEQDPHDADALAVSGL